MATLVLGAAGAAIGGAIGGTVLGLSAAVIGKAVGSTIGSVIDQSWMAPSQSYSTGRIDTYRLQSATEGVSIPRVFGRMRIPGQMIWRDTFVEHVDKKSSGGGKGGGPSVSSKSYSYTVSVAFAVGEGEIARIGRIWADGQELARDTLDLSVYSGRSDQAADDTIAAVEGLENVPAFRGTAYVVIKDLDVTQFGNRIPQFNFEVFRPAQPLKPTASPANLLEAVCMIPGAGEFVYGTTPVVREVAKGHDATINTHAQYGQADIHKSIEQLKAELPSVKTVSLVVTWFGDDLNCASCHIAPRVEHSLTETRPYSWSVAGFERQDVDPVSTLDGTPAFGGTPSDQSVVEAIEALKAAGYKVVIYPFIMMDIPGGSKPNNPYGGGFQPAYPWRGEITSSADTTPFVQNDITSFFGTTKASDFDPTGLTFNGLYPQLNYRALILHYARLSAYAGGVDGFLIGSELRGLTRLRNDQDNFPAVDALIDLLGDTRAILGDDTQIGYAADWSEYFGYQPPDGSGDIFYNLDPLWMNEDIDFIGIDAYFPLSDWRDTADHLDDGFRSGRDEDYLLSNVEDGEGYAWYYASDADRQLQIRSDITDGAYGMHWVYRYKDIAAWWRNPHHERRDGVITSASVWVPETKPIWLTEIGCPAVRNGANQPNVFPDPKSDLPQLPYFSDGSYDPIVQEAYITAILKHFSQNNPVSEETGDPMVDTSRIFGWAWDARPWPEFPALTDVWADGARHALGHWLTGRFSAAPIADVVAELCELCGLTAYDVSALEGRIDGAMHDGGDAPRVVLQALIMSHNLVVSDRRGVVTFVHADDTEEHALVKEECVQPDDSAALLRQRAPSVERADALALRFYDGTGGYDTKVAASGGADAHLPEVGAVQDIPIAATPSDMGAAVSRLLLERQGEGDSLTLTLPPSRDKVAVGDTLLDEAGRRYRVQTTREGLGKTVEATSIPKIAGGASRTGPVFDEPKTTPGPSKPDIRVLQLPHLSKDHQPDAVYIAAHAEPWGQGLAVYQGLDGDGFTLLDVMDRPSLVGTLTDDLPSGPTELWQRDISISAKFTATGLATEPELSVLNGANSFAVGSDTAGWEVLQAQSIVLQEDGHVHLSNLLRGRLGTDALIPNIWPSGTQIVALNEPLFAVLPDGVDWDQEIELRIGPADRPASDDTFVHVTISPRGVGLIPYAPSHLRLTHQGADLSATWVPRVALDGDSWSGEIDVPYTGYRVRVSRDGDVLRETTTALPQWTYSVAHQIADGFQPGDHVSVSALGAQTGYGFEAWSIYDG